MPPLNTTSMLKAKHRRASCNVIATLHSQVFEWIVPFLSCSHEFWHRHCCCSLLYVLNEDHFLDEYIAKWDRKRKKWAVRHLGANTTMNISLTSVVLAVDLQPRWREQDNIASIGSFIFYYLSWKISSFGILLPLLNVMGVFRGCTHRRSSPLWSQRKWKVVTQTCSRSLLQQNVLFEWECRLNTLSDSRNPVFSLELHRPAQRIWWQYTQEQRNWMKAQRWRGLELFTI